MRSNRTSIETRGGRNPRGGKMY